MYAITKDNYYILTGAMGGGKSTILDQLRLHGTKVIEEPARQILAEQRSIDGDGVPDKDEQLFTQLLLSRSLCLYQQMQPYEGPIIFDRGIPDSIEYANLFNFHFPAAEKAAQLFRYNPLVFFTPAWQEIYKTDDERKMTYQQANQFATDIKNRYQQLGYQVIHIPLVSPKQRADFILEKID